MDLCRLLFIIGLVITPVSCSKENNKYDPDDDPVIPYREWSSTKKVVVSSFGRLGFKHQSTALYGDYAFFVADGRAEICMYSMERKCKLYTLTLQGKDPTVYHCNQSTFGVDKYLPSDPFPLLYISQRAGSEGRCFTEVFRIVTSSEDFDSPDFSFSVELVQTIYFPIMTNDNSMGNVNVVIDTERGMLYTYSRNNNPFEQTYSQCRISQFDIPDIYEKAVYLKDDDILSSFMADYSAFNMQGGCIHEGILYVGQGYFTVGYIVLNVIDLEKRKQIRQMNLMSSGVYWEPEGCFFYGSCVMLAETEAIHEMHKKNK